MAKGTRHSPRMMPYWPPYIGVPDTAPSIQTITLDAVGEKTIEIVDVCWSDGATHNVASIRWATSATLTNGTVRKAIRALDTANGPPPRDDGSDAGNFFVDHVNLASGAVTSTLGTVKSCAHGATICVVTEITAYVSGSCTPNFVFTAASGANDRPAVTSYLSSTYAVSNARYPAFTLVGDDGAIGWGFSAFPQLTSITAQTFNSGTTPDEYSNAFTVVDPCWIGAMTGFRQNAAGGDYELNLYEGTTVKAGPVTTDSNTWPFNVYRSFMPTCFPDVALTSGNVYRVALKPTTATNVTQYVFLFAVAGDLAAWAPGWGMSTRTDAGAWGAVSTTQLICGLLMGSVAEDNGAGATGGNANILTGSVVK